MKLGLLLPLAFLPLALLSTALAQTSIQTPANPPATPDQPNTLRASATLVLVPALVTTKKEEPVFTLTADDFTLTDDGIPQALRLEDDADKQPIALVIVLEAGGEGAGYLDAIENLTPLIDGVIGNAEHTVAVVGFDSEPALVQPFTAELSVVDKALVGIGPGDGKAAILDALNFSVDLLRKQPPRYRRVILMFSETHDHGSRTSIPEALRSVSDTNTAIYSFAFSSTKADAKEEVRQANSPDPYPVHGCMGRDPDADPTKQKNRGEQAYDCASDLLPPLRLAKIAYIAATGALRKNVPETVAHLTGGEYYSFSNDKISNVACRR